MLTVLNVIRYDFLSFMFEFYEALYDRSHKLALEYLESKELDRYKFWSDVGIYCVYKRQKLLKKLVRVRGHLM